MWQVEAGSALRSARRSLAISVATASKLAGVSASTIKRWESGKHLPSGPELQTYLDLIGTHPDSGFRSVCNLEGLKRPSDADRSTPRLRMLRAKRRRQMLTLEDISLQTGLSIASLHRYEIGERTPDVDTLRELAKAYGCGEDEQELLCDPAAAESSNLLLERFLEPGKQPHYWLYKRVEDVASRQTDLTPDQAVDLVHSFMLMGDHRGVLEAWSLVKSSIKGVTLTPDRKAEISLSLILAHLTVSQNALRAREKLGRWREYAEDLPPGTESSRAMSHLARIAAALGELDEAENWVGQLQCQAEKEGDLGVIFVCGVNRLMLSFDRLPCARLLDDLDRVRSLAVGPLQGYTGDVAALYMFDRLGEDTLAATLLRQCLSTEATYGFGSPLAARIKRRRRANLSDPS